MEASFQVRIFDYFYDSRKTRVYKWEYYIFDHYLNYLIHSFSWIFFCYFSFLCRLRSLQDRGISHSPLFVFSSSWLQFQRFLSLKFCVIMSLQFLGVLLYWFWTWVICVMLWFWNNDTARWQVGFLPQKIQAVRDKVKKALIFHYQGIN